MIESRDPATQEITWALATGRFDGFISREVRVPTSGDRPTKFGNPRTDSEILWNEGLETPFIAGREGTVEDAQSIVAEGEDYLVLSGDGAIEDDTAAGTYLSFADGKFKVAEEGDEVSFRLTSQMTPIDDGEVRITAERVAGFVMAA